MVMEAMPEPASGRNFCLGGCKKVSVRFFIFLYIFFAAFPCFYTALSSFFTPFSLSLSVSLSPSLSLALYFRVQTQLQQKAKVNRNKNEA